MERTNLCSGGMPLGGRLVFETTRHSLEEGSTELVGTMNPGEYVRVRVPDTGSGMSVDTVERVFEPFFTLESKRVPISKSDISDGVLSPDHVFPTPYVRLKRGISKVEAVFGWRRPMGVSPRDLWWLGGVLLPLPRG